MARTLTPKDAHTLVNSLVRQMTGQTSITATDASSFVSTGEFLLQSGVENVFNALSILLNRTIIAARPYQAKLSMIQAENESAYASRVRKVSYYAQDADPAGNFNTDLYTNFADGYTSGENAGASTKSQWEQHPPILLEMNFGGVSVWQDCITQYEDAVRYAFTSEEEFNRFVAGYMVEHGNDIESQKEAWNRLAILQHIAATYVYATEQTPRMAGSVIDLTTAYNTRFGTNYTGAQLRSTYLKEFLAFFVAEFKNASDYLRERNKNFHWSPAKTVDGVDYSILRHTPYDRQRVILYEPLFREAEAMVLPEIFRPNYLDIDTQYEGVSFWQSTSDRAAINVTPAITSAQGVQAAASEAVELPYIVGMIFDRDALMTSYNLEKTRTTPIEARKGYFNTWFSMAKNIISDATENTIIFIMSDNE